MSSGDGRRDRLEAALAGSGGAVGSADRLCHACVDLLGVEGAAISVIHDGASRGTFGSSGESSRRWDEFQFTFGEGPCLDAVSGRRPVIAEDLDNPGEVRWPAFSAAMRNDGIRAVFALPVSIAAFPMAALDLFRGPAGLLDDDSWQAAVWASQLASLPLLDLMGANVDWAEVGDGGAWSQLASLERVEVYQATGMIQNQLDVDAAEALARLRAYAFSHDMTASEVAWSVIERRLVFNAEDSGGPDAPRGSRR